MINIVTTSNRTHASFRYRTEVIQRALLRSGVKCSISPTFLLEADTCLYSKHFCYNDFSDAIGAKGMGKRVIFDICDNHFERTHADHYFRMVDLADELTCNSDAMARIIRRHTKRSAKVIPDPIVMQPIDRVPDLTKWCWIGHHSNLPALIEWMPLLELMDQPVTVCTTYGKDIEHPLAKMTPWTPEAGEKILDEHGVCLIPYGDDEASQAKSPNRIIEALNKSMVVVTNGVEASRQFDSAVERMPAYVKESSIEKMKLGREYARKYFNADAIGKLWKGALE